MSACPECGVVPSRFVEGDHNSGCTLAPSCPACGCDPNGMGHSTCPVGAAQHAISAAVRAAGLPTSNADRFAIVRTWLETQPPPDEWTAYALRHKGYGDLLS